MKKVTEKKVMIPAGGVTLPGDLSLPEHAQSLVIFSHGNMSSRFSPRNRFVAKVLNENGMATLLADLMTAKEDQDYPQHSTIELFTRRLLAITRWVLNLPALKHLPIGYFGANTGAASALKAAVTLPNHVQAIVARGGRVDLAQDDLPKIRIPVLMIVGSLDEPVIELNDEAFEQMTCHRELKIVWGASHFFEEPGKLDEVARLTVSWFEHYLVSNSQLVG